jgi:glycosyltransferase involved in cell wall biosynthesis
MTTDGTSRSGRAGDDDCQERGLEMLFVGEAWQGSSARSLREALARLPRVSMHDVAEDSFLPGYRARSLRVVNRVLRPLQVAELEREITRKLHSTHPGALVVYKGVGVRADLIRRAGAAGVATVNVFPDCSPHAHGPGLKEALGEYDLVISTKPFHPDTWKSVYGYSNPCVFVPHGYDPDLHFWEDAPRSQEFDVVLAATWRPEYGRLMRDFARAWKGRDLRVAVAGHGWHERWSGFPERWIYAGAPHGRAYGAFLRRGKIAIAPVQREVVIAGGRQPGDEDSTRTYELAAAYCFFLHRRTDYVRSVYDEQTEVPMWDTPEELTELIARFLPRDEQRRAMARAAHMRAVPAYSISRRAVHIVEAIEANLDLTPHRGGAPA